MDMKAKGEKNRKSVLKVICDIKHKLQKDFFLANEEHKNLKIKNEIKHNEELQHRMWYCRATMDYVTELTDFLNNIRANYEEEVHREGMMD